MAIDDWNEVDRGIADSNWVDMVIAGHTVFVDRTVAAAVDGVEADTETAAAAAVAGIVAETDRDQTPGLRTSGMAETRNYP